MTVTDQQRAVLKRLAATKQALVERTAREWLAVTYKKHLFGGWDHPVMGAVTRRHDKAIEFHEACKDPEYKVLLIAGGNRSGKSHTGLSEFCAWIRGERPWDGTETAPRGNGRRWILAGQSFSEAFPSTLNPYFEQRMADWIVERKTDQRKNAISYVLKNGDIVKCLSYQQWDKASKQAGNPFEGSMWYGAYFDEPPPYDVWIAVQRGLVTGASQGWGKAIIAATILQHPWLLHEIYSEAHNMGGNKRDVYATHFTIYDNPFNTPEAIERFSADMSDELKQVRLYGRPRFLSGRVFPEFDEDYHIYDRELYDPLKEEFSNGAHSGLAPIIMAVDPHHAKAWAMSWGVVLPDETLYVIREWPEKNYQKMGHADLGYDDYAAIIKEVESSWEGGSKRVLWREFDPNMARTPFTASSGSTMQKEMRRRGLYFRTDVNDKVVQGHEIIHTRLQWDKGKDAEPDELNRPHLFVEKGCMNLIWAFQNYAWEDYKDSEKGVKPTPKEPGKDQIDTLRYILSRKPRFRNWQRRDDWYQSQIERRRTRMSA